MSLPRHLKNFNVFVDGQSFLGEAKSGKLPNLAIKLEAFRSGGMNRAVGVDMGSDDLLELELTFAGFIRAVLAGYARPGVDSVLIRLVGAFEREDDGQISSYEVVARGRYSEIEHGEWKTGALDASDFKPKFACAYYKVIIDGEVVYEEDILNMILIVDGVDRMAERRAAIQA